MALRVLLADESNTIKKVFQLSLQEYAVEVRPVNLGIDVEQVARSFKPHIIFTDVLLQKLNGYDMCSHLKSSADLKDIPVVLMWSNFMEFDNDKFQACGANERLEKPFEVSDLKRIVNKLVPKTKAQKLSQFLTYPDIPEVEEELVLPPKKPTQAATPPPVIPNQTSTTDENWGMESFDPIPDFDKNLDADKSLPDLTLESVEDDFQPVSLNPVQRPSANFQEPEPEMAAAQDLELIGNSELEVTGSDLWEKQELKFPTPGLSSQPDLQVEDFVEGDVFSANRRGTDTWDGFDRRQRPAVDTNQLKELIQTQYKDEIRKIVKEMVPAIAKEIIQEELNKLLTEMDGQA
ncbi:MAG: response regulator [Bdellovibrionaceae bacterium]|jgi:two-component system, cell cycle response regulator|nr:response regulator [Pseudobdellovibrionaceae bacterium]